VARLQGVPVIEVPNDRVACLSCCPLPTQSALLSEREETKLALVMEKQALEEARTARIKVSFE
jgi:hypothetical protein